MSEHYQGTANNVLRKTLWRAIFLLAALMILLACSKEKASEHKAASRTTGPCEVADKLQGGIAKHLEVNYGGKAKLLGITADKLSKNQLKVYYFWQLIDDLGPYDVAYVHFADSDNKILFGNDHDFCQRRPFGELKDKFIKETFVVNIPDTAIGKIVNIKIGIYAPDLKESPRLKIDSAGGMPIDDNKTRAIVEKINL